MQLPPPLQKKKKNKKSLDINIQWCFQPKVYFHSNIVLPTAAKCAQKKPWQMLVIFTRCHCSKILIYFAPCRTTVCSHFHRNVHGVYQSRVSLPSTHIAPNSSQDWCQHNLYYSNLLDSDRLAWAWGAETEQLPWECFVHSWAERRRMMPAQHCANTELWSPHDWGQQSTASPLTAPFNLQFFFYYTRAWVILLPLSNYLNFQISAG